MEKKTDFNEAAEDGEVGATANPGDRLDELAGLVKSLVQSQTARDQQIEKESAEQQQRWRSMQHQFQQIQAQVRKMKDDNQQDQTQSAGTME